MKKKNIFIIVALLVVLAAGALMVRHLGTCMAGGGGSEHIAPKQFTTGTPLVLELKLSRWGAPQCMKGSVIDRFTEVKCHFRAKGAADFTTLDMQGRAVDDNNAAYACPIPADAVTSEIEYYFDYKMDGVYSRRDEPVLESVKP